MTNTAVAVTARRAVHAYGSAPFHPPVLLPEFASAPWLPRGTGDNAAYLLVREALHLLGYDAARYGSPDWNPLGGLIRRGVRVVVKPNFVMHPPAPGFTQDAITTHAAVLRAVVDYALLATGPEGQVTICDVPLQDADFALLTELNGARALGEFYAASGLRVPVCDFRRERVVPDADGYAAECHKLVGDPRGYVAVDVGKRSALEPISGAHQRFAVTNYDHGRLSDHHAPGKHEYLFSRTVLEADVFINVPKLKVHQKTGLTASLKNIIGVCGDKSWLPHYRIGSAAAGGDEYPAGNRAVSLNTLIRRRLQRHGALLWKSAWAVWQVYKRAVLHLPPGAKLSNASGGWPTDGAWWGNDTLWRTIADLNLVLRFADAAGHLQERPCRRYLSIVDAIVAGEGNGPLYATPRPLGAVLAGEDPLAVDLVCARLLGYDWRQIPMLSALAALAPAFSGIGTNPSDVETLHSDDAAWLLMTAADHPFEAPLGWRPVVGPSPMQRSA